MTRFTEVASGVYVLRYPVLDVNVTLVVGDGAALVVDTLSTDAQATELADAVAAVTPHPCTIVNTHHHFDHCFGNATLAGPTTDIWGHAETVATLTEAGATWQRRWYAQWQEREPELARGLAAVTIVPPHRVVRRQSTLRLGERLVLLRHLGRGHTAGDLVVQVPDADVLIAGDLVEQGAPPCFEDSYPLQWPATLAGLLRLTGPRTLVVPGHGALVDRGFVAEQQAELAALAWLIREGDAHRAPPERVAARAPYPAPVALTAVERGYASLAGAD